MGAQNGTASVLLYLDGVADAQLTHPYDGGEGYMMPLLRSAIRYARTHYGGGCMRDVLMSEGGFRECSLPDEAAYRESEHRYFLTARYDKDMVRKVYHVYAAHGKADGAVPVYVRDMPETAVRMT